MSEPATPDLRPLSGEMRPPEWKGMDDFAAGIDGNRLSHSQALVGTRVSIRMEGRARLDLSYLSADTVEWRSDAGHGTDWYEAVEVRPGLVFHTLTYAADPLRAAVLIVNRDTGRTLTVESTIDPEPTPGRPRVSQTFRSGVVDGDPVSGAEPAPTRDFIGWRALYRYSPHHLYEHVYLSSERYAWQCLVGEQRGHGDVDLATTWSLGDSLYVFTFREFLIPVAATWLYDLSQMRTTGTFFGLGSDGSVKSAPGGAFITDLGRVVYPDDQPV